LTLSNFATDIAAMFVIIAGSPLFAGSSTVIKQKHLDSELRLACRYKHAG
jgi:hypothetical protein